MSRFNGIFVLSQSLIYFLKTEATCSIARIINSGGNLIARKRLASIKILPHTSQSRTEQIYSQYHFKTSNSFTCQIQQLKHFNI